MAKTAWFYFYNKPKENLEFHSRFGERQRCLGFSEQTIESSYLILSSLFNLCLRHLFHVYTSLTQIMLKRDFVPSPCAKLGYNSRLNNASPFSGLSVKEAFSLRKHLQWKQDTQFHIYPHSTEICIDSH